MGSQMRFIVVGGAEPALWAAIAMSSLAALLLGRAVGRRAAANAGRRALAVAALDLAVLLPVLLVLEVALLSVLFAVRSGGATACLPVVRHLLLIPAGVGALAALLAWHRRAAALPSDGVS